MIASRTPSEIWSQILSGWPSVTDSDVNRCSFSESFSIGSSVVDGQEELRSKLVFAPPHGKAERADARDVFTEGGIQWILREAGPLSQPQDLVEVEED